MEKKFNKNFRTVRGCLGARNETTDDREEYDYYATEPKAIEWLMKIENLDKNIWECACGEGHLAKPLIRAGYNVKCTDIIDRGFGIGGVDFLKENEPYNGDIVTNPPYSQALKFIKHALSLVGDGQKVIMFLKVQFMEGQKRKSFFENTPPKTIWVSSSRIKCGKNGIFKNSMMAFAWYIWEKGYHGPTVLKWFN